MISEAFNQTNLVKQEDFIFSELLPGVQSIYLDTSIPPAARTLMRDYHIDFTNETRLARLDHLKAWMLQGRHGKIKFEHSPLVG